MSSRSPPRLLDLAIQSLLQDEALATLALEDLPTELFPPLFMAAVAGRHCQTVKAMVGAWPFPRLPLGSLLGAEQPARDILEAALDGVDILLSQKVRPRRWKLKVLDLCSDSSRNFWRMWSREEEEEQQQQQPEAIWSPMKSGSVVGTEGLEETHSVAPVEVLLDLCLQNQPDEPLTFLLTRAQQWRGLLHLCCRELAIFSTAHPRVIQKLLEMVQLHRLQEIQLNWPWTLCDLAWLPSHLGRMVSLRRFYFSRLLSLSNSMTQEEEEMLDQLLTQCSSQSHCLSQLQDLHLDSVLFLRSHLGKVLGVLKMPLKALRLTNCSFLASDFEHLSLSSCTSSLNYLDLSNVALTGFDPQFLEVLLARVSGTLQSLDLSGCGLTSSQLSALTPALGLCSRLHLLRCCGSLVSLALLEGLLRHILPRCPLQLLDLPVPLECFRGDPAAHHREHLLVQLRQVGEESGRAPTSVNFDHSPDSSQESILMLF